MNENPQIDFDSLDKQMTEMIKLHSAREANLESFISRQNEIEIVDLQKVLPLYAELTGQILSDYKANLKDIYPSLDDSSKSFFYTRGIIAGNPYGITSLQDDPGLNIKIFEIFKDNISDEYRNAHPRIYQSINILYEVLQEKKSLDRALFREKLYPLYILGRDVTLAETKTQIVQEISEDFAQISPQMMAFGGILNDLFKGTTGDVVTNILGSYLIVMANASYVYEKTH